MNATAALVVRAYCLLLALLCASGATPAPVEVSGWEPDDGALVVGCPSGSCDGRRPG